MSAFVRISTIFISIFTFLVHMGVVWLMVRERWRRIYYSNRILAWYGRWGLWVLKVKVNIFGQENIVDKGSGLYVGNHLSYMDVLAFVSHMPACFVTSQEIKETPVLGQICQMAGCLFVERRNKTNIHNEVADIRDGLLHGLNVAIFPEATSTNGEQILRFRRPLFVAAIDAERPVMPFCLNYRKVGGRPIATGNRDQIMWYGDMAFASHLWSLAKSGGIELDLHFLPPIYPQQKMDPTLLAEVSQRSVESIFIPVPKSV